MIRIYELRSFCDAGGGGHINLVTEWKRKTFAMTLCRMQVIVSQCLVLYP